MMACMYNFCRTYSLYPERNTMNMILLDLVQHTYQSSGR